jgi:6-phosphogluconolactonase
MLAHVPVPPGNIHGITFAGTPAEAARAYQYVLQSYYGAERLDPARPLFDIVLLGMGPDGHTASLIPGEPVLDEQERWVAEVTHGRPEPRITLTYPALDSSRSTAFVAAGGDKHAMMQRVVAGERELPAARIRPVGELIWFFDEAAHGGR